MGPKVDLLVLGAGPAGCRAALIAAQGGASVLLLEAKRRVGAMPHCAEFVPQALGLEMEIPATCRIQAVSGMETRLRDERVFSPTPGWMLDRQVFDYLLAIEASQAGAEVWAGSRFQGWRGEKILIQRGGQHLELEAGIVVAADGAASPVARSLGFDQAQLLAGVQYQVPLKRELGRTSIFLDRAFAGGYAWLFPKGKVANLGLGCWAEAKPRQLLEGFRREALSMGLIGEGVLAVSGGVIPVSGPRSHLCRKRVIFCGDAAGLTHPITGAGIPQALFSGAEAGRAALEVAGGDGAALDQYQHEVLGRYGGYLSRGLEARRRWDSEWEDGGFQDLMRTTWPAWRGSGKHGELGG